PEAVPIREPSDQLKQQVKDRDGNRCLACGETNARHLQIDHVAPAYSGEDNSLRNLQTLCRACNLLKKVRTINFTNHLTSLDQPPAWMVESAQPDPEDAADPEQWERFLRRSVNFFFGCAAVDSARIGRKGE